MMRQSGLDSDEEMDLEGQQVEEGVEMERNSSMLIDTGEEGLGGDGSGGGPAVPKTVTGEDGKTFLNPASLGLAPKPKPHLRPGTTGTRIERAAQQLIHSALEFRDIHTAIRRIPAALGTSPSNIPTLLWELLVWHPKHLPLERMLFAVELAQAAEKCLRKSSLGPDCFCPEHPYFGSWSARAGAGEAGGDSPRRHSGGGESSGRGDGIERVGRGGYILVVEQVIHGYMKMWKWDAALRWAGKILQLDMDDDCGVRFVMPVGMLKLGMGLPCVKFCMGWLDELGGAGPAVPVPGGAWAGAGGGGVVGGVDLGLDMVQGRYVRAAGRWPRMAFLVALGCWWMFVESGMVKQCVKRGSAGNGHGTGSYNGFTVGGSGLPVCKSARAWLRLGHKSNRHVLRILLTMITHKTTYFGPTGYMTGAQSTIPSPTITPTSSTPTAGFPDPAGYEEANDFIYSTHGLFMDEARDVQRWLVDTAHMWVVNTCPGCGQKEGRVGEHKACLGCRGEWYCGVECQRRCWGVHKVRCREVARERKMKGLGRGLGA